ncbi:hypothetical protein GCM10022261_26220 [Brevibacterium daeguense]|uniref:Major facilitator superfamily (MFS) profile domain-containing protein n=1 Tax=Brevibacterium daeguense TaxID=909936 RepID=A0ABP8EM98_9MICO|nr:MFS transporter [Brevibacterium daeguense]
MARARSSEVMTATSVEARTPLLTELPVDSEAPRLLGETSTTAESPELGEPTPRAADSRITPRKTRAAIARSVVARRTVGAMRAAVGAPAARRTVGAVKAALGKRATATAGEPMSMRAAVPAIFALALGGFGIGVAEFATMGLLPYIADDFGVSMTQASHSVTLYALGVVVGAPLITALAAKMERKSLLLGLAALFVIGSIVSTAAPTLELMLAARFLNGLPHGAFLGIAGIVAAGLVPENRRATALAGVSLGLPVANILGVPAAAALGATMGWRAAFAMIAVAGVITLLAVFVLVPNISAPKQTASTRSELSTLKRPQVVITLVAGAIGFGGVFAVYTFIAPTMTEVAGLSATLIPWVLVCYGVGQTLGAIIAGPLVDKSIEKSALAGIIGVGVVLLILGSFTHVGTIAVCCVLFMGLVGSIFTTALQARLLRESRDAPSLSAAMNHGSFNFANALGAFLGGVVIESTLGYRAPALLGVGLTLVGLTVMSIGVVTRRRSTTRTVIPLDG